MAKEEFEKLGFATEEEYKRIRSQASVKEGQKEGTVRRGKNKVLYVKEGHKGDTVRRGKNAVLYVKE